MTTAATLPPPSVIEPLDFERILATSKAHLLGHYPEAADTLALESSPLTKLLQTFSYRELLYRARVNDAARAHLLAFATGGDLDHLAAMFGLTRMAGEDDERLRLRLQLRIAALAGQGTREHYELTALTASTNVRAATARQSRPGAVHVVLWLHNPSLDTSAQVVQALNQDSARMLGVTVTVGTAQPQPIDIRAHIWRSANASPTLLADLQAHLQTQLAARAALGSPIARSWITTLLHIDGVAAVHYPSDTAPPPTIVLGADEYPTLGNVQLIDAGVL